MTMDLQNFRDFLQIYNHMSESCFTRCVNSFQSRDLTEEETSCVDYCSSKNVRVNHKIMAVYMEVQPLIVQKRIEEMNNQNASVLSTEPVNAESVPKVEAVTNAETNLESSSGPTETTSSSQ